MGTWARRIAVVPLRPTVTTLSSPEEAAISRAAKRMVLVFREPARPRSVVKSTMRRAPGRPSASSGWCSSSSTAATSASTSSSLSL